jgi:N-methylhydantoinase B
VLADTDADQELALAVYEGPPTDAGPQIIATASDYIDATVVFRQYCCPICWTAISSSVVPADHDDNPTTIGARVVAAG